MKKTALVTGASKRIGRSITEYLAETGWNVMVHYNSSEHLAGEFVHLLESGYPDQFFQPVKANLADMDDVASFIPKLISQFGGFQLLINNASVFNGGYLKETSLELYDTQMNVNLKAPFMLMRDYANLCKGGNIINLVDTRVTTNKSNFAAYSISKKALWELTKMAALEFAPLIRVNAIAPGVTLPPEDKDENYLFEMAKNIPMKKPGGLAPIIESIAYILKNKSLTGQMLFSDGGENLGQNV